MGLDMYGTSAREIADQKENFHNWRAHHSLDNWMRELYAAKSEVTKIEDRSFYIVELTAPELERLEVDIRAGMIKPGGEHLPDHDFRFIAEARQRLMRGLHVFYHANY